MLNQRKMCIEKPVGEQGKVAKTHKGIFIEDFLFP